MKIIRTKFNKEGDMIYISHLDLQQLLQRAFRRAEIDLVHSQGFNPHPKISYGNALALGTESQGEYVDVEIEEDLSVEEYLNRMNAQLPEGIKFIEAKEIDKQEPSLASVIEYGEYIFTIETEKTLTKEYVKSKILEFMSQDEIMITKKNKKGKIVESDIRPMIRNFDLLDVQDNVLTLEATIATGSKANLNTNIFIPKIFCIIINPITNAILKNINLYKLKIILLFSKYILKIKYDYIKLLLKNLIIQIWRYKMFEEIRDIIAEQLSIDDLDELTLDTSLKDDLNADSLDAVEVIMALEDKYDIEIAEEDAENFKTIADIVNYIEENK